MAEFNKLEITHFDTVVDVESGELVVDVFSDNYNYLQRFIMETWNICLKINPANPLAVAKNIEKMYQLLDESATIGQYSPTLVLDIKQVLANIKKEA